MREALSQRDEEKEKNLQDMNSVFVFIVAKRELLDRPTARLTKEFDCIEGLKRIPFKMLSGLAKICGALAYIHGGVGLCHRNIKQQNVLVNPHTHHVKLRDFGSAKVLQHLEDISQLARAKSYFFEVNDIMMENIKKTKLLI
ncbi:hypothetical protein REPUB_Repub18cG0061300 [Reevesia pubescens]